ncbi:MAG TPA: pyrimidine dimer DNA glycosylase/endonuclease V [Rhodanobacteraceae bacterium]|nr:pyrimidine dimer DNA glycosylase/endonuclease V [Rhodanobacteraceae bacterium]
MRLWTIHPKYLDPKGLVALWREALLARAVLRGETNGYRHHPQLDRFRAHSTPRSAINAYLADVLEESRSRGYSFDASKVGPVRGRIEIPATTGQIAYEWRHLLRKLEVRSPDLYARARAMRKPLPHPLFRVTAGAVADWERA